MEKSKRYSKAELLSCIDTMSKVNDMLMHEATRKQLNIADTLVQCQELAIMMGNFLETLGEDSVKFVKHLENYCEYIFEISQAESVEKMQPFLDFIKEELYALKIQIEFDLPILKKEVVFLPYKASMWDSLESVWKKYDEDESVDAYVIPIPYYDKNNDGTLGEMHYEGSLYPEDVPIVSYEEYDFEGRHPDEIYIHNPYDDYNFVTSVDPRFYSSVLKGYTDKLVYIPYFVLPEINPYEENERKSIAHYVVVPGVLHAHKIIVQSERMKQAYIEIMCDEMGNSPQVRRYWEDKLDGSGSPKLSKDKIVRQLDIPDEWERLIKREDGSSKKVIFYNTTVTALLKSGGNLLAKMQMVFDTFSKYTEDVTLLWRPHPLMEATLKSMRGELLEEYLKLKEYYIYNKIGIFDDTADLHRAIALSDVYYGDSSSVERLFKNAGKYVILQNLGEYAALGPSMFEQTQIVDGCTYGLNSRGILYKKEPGTQDFQIECMITDDLNEYNYIDFVAYKRKLIFPNFLSDQFVIYDIDSKEKTNLEIDGTICKYYVQHAVVGNQILFIQVDGAGHPIVVDMDTFTITDIGESFEVYPHLLAGWQQKGMPRLYYPCKEKGKIICYNIEENKAELISVMDETYTIFVLYDTGEEILLITDKPVIGIWNKNTAQIKEIPIELAGYEAEQLDGYYAPFSKVVELGGYYYYIPSMSNMLIRQKKGTHILEKVCDVGTRSGWRSCIVEDTLEIIWQDNHDDRVREILSIKDENGTACVEVKVNEETETEIIIRDLLQYLC